MFIIFILQIFSFRLTAKVRHKLELYSNSIDTKYVIFILLYSFRIEFIFKLYKTWLKISYLILKCISSCHIILEYTKMIERVN